MSKQPEKTDIKRYSWVMWVGFAGIAIWLIISFTNALSIRSALLRELAAFEPSLATARAEQAQLEERLEYVQSNAYVEQWSREEARMTLPGETLIILDASTTAMPRIPETQLTLEPESAAKPVWVHWWRTLTGQD